MTHVDCAGNQTLTPSIRLAIEKVLPTGNSQPYSKVLTTHSPLLLAFPVL
jgi:hypothetical protein